MKRTGKSLRRGIQAQKKEKELALGTDTGEQIPRGRELGRSEEGKRSH